MDEQQHQFINAYAGQTVLNPLGLAMTLVMGALVFCLPRQRVIWPFLIIACFVSQAQRIYVLGMNFDLIRILVICGMARILARGEYRWFEWNRLDVAVVAWSLAATLLPVVRMGADVLVNRLGNLYDIIGMYFLFRFVIRSFEDIWGIARCLIWLSFPISAFFLAELLTGRNAFSVFGGVPEFTTIREGRLRCQGAFSHSILAGAFWAAAVPLLAMGFWRGSRLLSGLALSAALFMIYASASATPISSLAIGAAGAACFFVRRKLRWVRWGIVGALVGLHLVMKQPVWHLVARMGSLGGSSWHRFALIDGAITHFSEWWLIGSYVGTAHWGHFTHDVTNFYIVEAIHGGVLLLTLFLTVIGLAFGCVGRAWRMVEQSRSNLLTVWAVGLCVLIHAANLFGVSYFGQIWFSWYLALAIAGSLGQFCGVQTVSVVHRRPDPKPVVARAIPARAVLPKLGRGIGLEWARRGTL